MKSAITGATAAQSTAASWRRWTRFSLPIIARAAVVRSAGCMDVDGHPLPATLELPDIMTLVHCYHWCQSPIKGMDDNTRRCLLSHFAVEMGAAMAALCERGLDLSWRLLCEESSKDERELIVALGVTRRNGKG